MTILLALLLGLAVLSAASTELKHVIRGDGYGHRPTPRSQSDDNESRARTFARLAH